MRTQHSAEGMDRARVRLPGLSPFRSAAEGRGCAPETVLLLCVGSFQSLSLLITNRSLAPAGPRVLSEVNCPRTRDLRQPFPASSRVACLWPRHSDCLAFGQRGHPGGVRRLFPARGLQRLGGSCQELGAGSTEEGAPRALRAPSTPWTGLSAAARSQPSRQPPRCHSALSSSFFPGMCTPSLRQDPLCLTSPGLLQPRVGASQVLSKCCGHEENPGPGCSKQPAPFFAT